MGDTSCEAGGADSHLAKGAVENPSGLGRPNPMEGGQTRESTTDHVHRDVARMEVIAQPTHISAHTRGDNIEQKGKEDNILISFRQPESGCDANVRQE